MYNLGLYLAENIWRDWKLHFIFAAEKKVHRQQGLIPGHALFLAMDDFFHRIVNFSKQSFVRKVAVANFATIAECYIISAMTVATISAADIPLQPKRGLTLNAPTPKGRTLRTTPGSVCLISQPDAQCNANPIGVRVLTRALHRHRCLYSSATLVDAIDTHLHHTHTIADNVNRRREIVPIW